MHCRKTEWKRLPEIVRHFDIAASTTTIGSALGGLIYVVVPAGQKLGPLDIKVSGENFIEWQQATNNPSSTLIWAERLARAGDGSLTTATASPPPPPRSCRCHHGPFLQGGCL